MSYQPVSAGLLSRQTHNYAQFNFQSPEFVSHYRDPQLQVGVIYWISDIKIIAYISVTDLSHTSP